MRAIIITGTSGGLGRAFFESFAKEPVRLISIARRFLPEQEMVAAQQPERVRLVQRELSELAGLPTAAEFAEWLSGEIDEVVYINNAAVVQPIGAIGTLVAEKITHSITVNFTAQMHLTNALFAVPGLTEKRVTVLNISSGAAKHTIDGWALYCSVKAGMEMFFDALRDQYKEHDGINVYNVNPGVMDTNMQSIIRSSEGVYFPSRERFLNLKSEGKLATPEQVAERIIDEHLK